MKAFVLGFLTAAALLIMLCFLWHPAMLMAGLGGLMDEDAIYLKSGGVVRGRIIDEQASSILVETAKGTYTLPIENCSLVRKNTLGRYFRELP